MMQGSGWAKGSPHRAASGERERVGVERGTPSVVHARLAPPIPPPGSIPSTSCPQPQPVPPLLRSPRSSSTTNQLARRQPRARPPLHLQAAGSCSMPSAAEVKALFRAYLRLGRTFPNYNMRHYITRRAKEEFHGGIAAAAGGAEAGAAEAAWARAREQLQVWQRQSVVYQLYGRKVKNVMELDEAATHAAH